MEEINNFHIADKESQKQDLTISKKVCFDEINRHQLGGKKKNLIRWKGAGPTYIKNAFNRTCTKIYWAKYFFRKKKLF